MTYYLEIEDDVREAALAQIQQMKGVKVIEVVPVTDEVVGSDREGVADEVPYTKDMILADIRAGLAEVKAARRTG